MSDEIFDFGLAPGESFEPDDLDDAIPLDEPHVMTALGAVDPGALGVTLPCEHVIVKPDEPGDPDFVLDSVDAALAELEDAAFAGIHAVVDLTPVDAGRDPESIYWVAQRAPVHLLVTTGYSGRHSVEPLLRDMTVAEIAGAMIGEIQIGIVGTPMRAGVISAGGDPGENTGFDERLLQAVAHAHRATGAPVVVQADRNTSVLDRLALLRENGVGPDRMIVVGIDFMPDVEPHLRRLLASGVSVVCGQLAQENLERDIVRAGVVRQLAEDGYLDRILISGGLARKSQWLAYGGAPGLRYLVESFPVILMEMGFSAPEVRRLLIDNPQRALTTLPPGCEGS